MSSQGEPAANGEAQNEPMDTTPLVPPKDFRLRIRVAGKTEELSYPRAFAVAHGFLKQRKCAPAAAIFEELTRATDFGPRAHILLAISKAGLSQYAEAFAILKRALSLSLAAAVYDVIIQSRMGFKDDALRDLSGIVDEHKELPTLCLWLGDMLEANDQVENATRCWKLAQERDHLTGAVALAAKHQLARLIKHPARSTPNVGRGKV